MNEEWRNISSCPGYSVSSLGNVIGPRGKKLKLLNRGNGYLQFTYKSRHKVSVHRAVAFAFIPNPFGYPCINHKDGNPKNNCVENLEWCSYGYNIHYSYAFMNRIDPRSIKVRCINTGEIFNSIRAAARSIGQSNSNLSRAVLRNGTCGGYKWEFIK